MNPNRNCTVRKPARLPGPRPLKELGQHFLQDENIAADIVERMNLRWEERTLEIGPGRGVLLHFLLKKCRSVTAVEIDQRLQKSLLKLYGGHPGLSLLFGDFLKFDLREYLLEDSTEVKIVGNIPYSLSSQILIHLFEVAQQMQMEGQVPLNSATLMLQREVARRICAIPGGREYGGITVFRSLVGQAELLFDVPAEAFVPPPKITSSVIQIRFYPEARYDIGDQFLFRNLVQTVFKKRRKMLKNSLGDLFWTDSQWSKNEFDFTLRPEELSVEDFIRLFRILKD